MYVLSKARRLQSCIDEERLEVKQEGLYLYGICLISILFRSAKNKLQVELLCNI